MSTAAPDRAPESLAGGTAQPLRGELEALLGADRVLGRASDIVPYASDASPHRPLARAGGMRCGTTKDSYSTVRSMTFVLPSGTTIDTAAPGAAERFAAAEPELAAGLAAIRDEIRADAELSERIRRKFAIKNTTGYRLCAFLDADEPLEIFRRLVVGSEGTLAFVAEAVFETVPLGRHTTLSLTFFEDVDTAVPPPPAPLPPAPARPRRSGPPR